MAKNTDNKSILNTAIIAVTILVLAVVGVLFYKEYTNQNNLKEKAKQEAVSRCREASKHQVSVPNEGSPMSCSIKKNCTYSTVESYDEDIYNKCLTDAGLK
jgi:hypothetical protein